MERLGYVALVVLGVLAIAYGGWTVSLASRADAETQGQVVDVEAGKRSAGRTRHNSFGGRPKKCQVEAEFDVDGKTYRAESDYLPELCTAAPGQLVEVHYRPDNPASNFVGTTKDASHNGWGLIGIGAVSALIGYGAARRT